jgi:hypothetical protein
LTPRQAQRDDDFAMAMPVTGDKPPRAISQQNASNDYANEQ